MLTPTQSTSQIPIKTLNLEEATQRRQIYLDRLFAEDLPAFKKWGEGKKSVDIETMKTHMNELFLVNQLIEDRKEKELQKKTCCLGFRHVSAITAIILGLQLVAWIGVGSYSIYEVTRAPTNSTSEECRRRSLGEVVVSVIEVFLTVVVVTFIKAINDDYDNFKLLTTVSRIEQQEEKHFQQLLLSLDEFKEKKKKEQFSHCVHCYDRMPEGEIKNGLLPRYQLLSLMIQMLPDEDPVKQKFLELEAFAFEISKQEKKKKTSHSNRKKAHLPFDPSMKTHSESSSDEGSPIIGKKFEGEKFSASFVVPKKIQLHKEGAKNTHISPSLELYEEFADLDTGKAKRHFEAQWAAIERDLKIEIYQINLGRGWMDNEGNIARTPEALPNFVPQRDLKSDLKVVVDNTL